MDTDTSSILSETTPNMPFFKPEVKNISTKDLTTPTYELSDRKKRLKEINDSKLPSSLKRMTMKMAINKFDRIDNKEYLDLENEMGEKNITNNVVGSFMKTDKASNIMRATAGIATGINNSLQNYTGTQQTINSGIHQGLQALGPWGMAASAITGTLDAIGASAGLKVDVLDSTTASRAGVGVGNKFGEMLSAIPGMGLILGASAGKKTMDANKSAYIDGMSPGYSKSVQDINASVDGGGKKLLFGKRNMNNFIELQNAANEKITNIAMQSEMARNNDVAQLYQSQNFNKYSGNTPRLLMAKDGIKFQNLDSARTLLQRITDETIKKLDTKSLLNDITSLINFNVSKNIKDLQKTGKSIAETVTAHKSELQRILKKNGLEKYLSILEDPNNLKNIQILGGILSSISQNKPHDDGGDISKFQLGGKIIDPSKNIIPAGALHKNRNHLSEYNEELQDQITEKGIPVVSEDENGDITQHAEIEVGEVIFNLENTKIIEGYWKQYKETEDESIAIECGKFLVKELLHNTVDKAGIKKTVE